MARIKALGILALIIGGGYLLTNSKNTIDPNECGSESMAYVMSQEFVKKQLKAPATAEFPWMTADGVRIAKEDRCRYRVVGYVDADNSFGAKLRKTYVAKMTFDAGKDVWTLDDLVM